MAAMVAVGSCGGSGDTGDATGPPASNRLAARGKELVADYRCLSCHTTTGAVRAGPTWKGLAGNVVKLSDGSTVVADHDYLVRSILDPDAQVVEGYVSGIMSAVIRPGSIDRDDAEAMAAYIKSLESSS